MGITMSPIGYVSHDVEEIPRNYTVSNIEGYLIMDEKYSAGLSDIKAGQRLNILFHFHKSPEFSDRFMRITPPIRDYEVGVFSTHSPFRPNPIGLSVVDVLEVDGCRIKVKGLDMLNETPILDIKPEICPEN